MVVVSLFIFTLLGACNSETTSGNDDVTGEDGVADEQAGVTNEQEDEDTSVEKTLVVGLDASPANLDSHQASSSVGMWCTDPFNDFLVWMDDTGTVLEPGIAESWDYVSDTEIKFYLRENVYFHNGRNVVADDIVFNVERVKDPENASFLANVFNNVEEVEVINDYELVFKLKNAYAPLLERLTKLAIIAPETEDFNNNPIGCGAFKLVRWDKDQQIVMEKFDQYWNPEFPNYDKLVIRLFTEYNSLLTAFLAKEVDVINWLGNVDIATIENSGHAYVQGAPASAFYVGANVDREPFSNPKVMKAIKYCIDKQACVDTVLLGYGSTTALPISKESEYYNEDLEWDQDLALAKQLMEEAGYAEGFSTNLIAPNTPVEGPLSEIIQNQLKEIGIEVKLEKLDVAAFLERRSAKDFDMMVCGYPMNLDPNEPMYRFYTSNGANGCFNYSNPDFDKLMDEGVSVYETDERKNVL